MPQASPASPAPRRRAPAAERRAQILAAALGCIAEKGYHAATMDDLVRASGLSKGSLYWHFRSKEEVFMALFDAFAEDFFADWEAGLAEGETTLDLLRRVGGFWVDAFATQGDLLHAWIQFLAHPLARDRLGAVYRESREKLGITLRRDIDRGVLRDLPVEGVAAALTAAMEGLLLQAMVDDAFDVRRHWDVLVEVLCGGIAR